MSGGGAGNKLGADEELAGTRRKQRFLTLRGGWVSGAVTRNEL